MHPSQLTASVHQGATPASTAPNAPHRYGTCLVVAWHNCAQVCSVAVVHSIKPQWLPAVVNAIHSPSTFLPAANTASSESYTRFCHRLFLWLEWGAHVKSSSHTAGLAHLAFTFRIRKYFTSSQQLKAALIAHTKSACQHSGKEGRTKRKSQQWSCCLLVIPVSNLEIRKQLTRELVWLSDS